MRKLDKISNNEFMLTIEDPKERSYSTIIYSKKQLKELYPNALTEKKNLINRIENFNKSIKKAKDRILEIDNQTQEMIKVLPELKRMKK